MTKGLLESRIEDAEFLIDQGLGRDEICRSLGASPKTLRRFFSRAERLDVWKRIAGDAA